MEYRVPRLRRSIADKRAGNNRGVAQVTPIRIRVLTALFALLLTVFAAMPASADSGVNSGEDGGFPGLNSGEDGGFPGLILGGGIVPSASSVDDGGF